MIWDKGRNYRRMYKPFMLCIKKLDTQKPTFWKSTVHEENNGVLLLY